MEEMVKNVKLDVVYKKVISVVWWCCLLCKFCVRDVFSVVNNVNFVNKCMIIIGIVINRIIIKDVNVFISKYL